MSTKDYLKAHKAGYAAGYNLSRAIGEESRPYDEDDNPYSSMYAEEVAREEEEARRRQQQQEEAQKGSSWLDSAWNWVFGLDYENTSRTVEEVKKGARLATEKGINNLNFEYGKAEDFVPQRVGMGLATGDLVRQGDDFFRTFTDKSGKKQIELAPVAKLHKDGAIKPAFYSDLGSGSITMDSDSFTKRARRTSQEGLKQIREGEGLTDVNGKKHYTIINATAPGKTDNFMAGATEPLTWLISGAANLIGAKDGTHEGDIASAETYKGEDRGMRTAGNLAVSLPLTFGEVAAATGLVNSAKWIPEIMKTPAAIGTIAGGIPSAIGNFGEIRAGDESPISAAAKTLVDAAGMAGGLHFGSKGSKAVAESIESGSGWLKPAAIEFAKQMGVNIGQAGASVAIDNLASKPHDKAMYDAGWSPAERQGFWQEFVQTAPTQLLTMAAFEVFGAAKTGFGYTKAASKTNRYFNKVVEADKVYTPEEINFELQRAMDVGIGNNELEYKALKGKFEAAGKDVSKTLNSISERQHLGHTEEKIISDMKQADLAVLPEDEQATRAIAQRIETENIKYKQAAEIAKSGELSPEVLVQKGITTDITEANKIAEEIRSVVENGGDLDSVRVKFDKEGNSTLKYDSAAPVKQTPSSPRAFSNVRGAVSDQAMEYYGKIDATDTGAIDAAVYVKTGQYLDHITNTYKELKPVAKEINVLFDKNEQGKTAWGSPDGVNKLFELYTKITGESPVSKSPVDVINKVMDVLTGTDLRYDASEAPYKYIDVDANSGAMSSWSTELLASADRKALAYSLMEDLKGLPHEQRVANIKEAFGIDVPQGKKAGSWADKFAADTAGMPSDELSLRLAKARGLEAPGFDEKYGAMAGKDKGATKSAQPAAVKTKPAVQNGVSNIVKDTASNIGKVVPIEIPRGVEDVLPNIEPVKPVSIKDYQPSQGDLLGVTDFIMKHPELSDADRKVLLQRSMEPDVLEQTVKRSEPAKLAEQTVEQPVRAEQTAKPMEQKQESLLEQTKSPTVEEPVPGEPVAPKKVTPIDALEKQTKLSDLPVKQEAAKPAEGEPERIVEEPDVKADESPETRTLESVTDGTTSVTAKEQKRIDAATERPDEIVDKSLVNTVKTVEGAPKIQVTRGKKDVSAEKAKASERIQKAKDLEDVQRTLSEPVDKLFEAEENLSTKAKGSSGQKPVQGRLFDSPIESHGDANTKASGPIKTALSLADAAIMKNEKFENLEFEVGKDTGNILVKMLSQGGNKDYKIKDAIEANQDKLLSLPGVSKEAYDELVNHPLVNRKGLLVANLGKMKVAEASMRSGAGALMLMAAYSDATGDEWNWAKALLSTAGTALIARSGWVRFKPRVQGKIDGAVVKLMEKHKVVPWYLKLTQSKVDKKTTENYKAQRIAEAAPEDRAKVEAAYKKWEDNEKAFQNGSMKSIGRGIAHMEGPLAEEIQHHGVKGQVAKDNANREVQRLKEEVVKVSNKVVGLNSAEARGYMAKVNDEIWTATSRIMHEPLFSSETSDALIKKVTSEEGVKARFRKMGVPEKSIDSMYRLYIAGRQAQNVATKHQVAATMKDLYGVDMKEPQKALDDLLAQSQPYKDKISELKTQIQEHKNYMKSKPEIQSKLKSGQKMKEILKGDKVYEEVKAKKALVEAEFAPLKNRLEALQSAMDFMVKSEQMHYIHNRWAMARKDKPYGFSAKEVKDGTDGFKAVDQNLAVVNEMHHFKTEQDRTNFVNQWLKEREFEPVAGFPNIYRVIVENGKGEIVTSLVKVNDKIDFSLRDKFRVTTIKQLRRMILAIGRDEMDVKTYKEAIQAELNKAKEMFDNPDSKDVDMTDPDGLITNDIESLIKVVENASSKTALVNSMQDMFTYMLAPRAKKWHVNKNAQGYAPEGDAITEWTKLWDMGINDTMTQTGNRYVNAHLVEGIEKQLLEANSLGIHSEYVEQLGHIYDSILYRGPSIDFLKPVADALTGVDVEKVVSAIDGLMTGGSLTLNQASGVKNIVAGNVTTAAALVGKGFNPLGMVKASKGVADAMRDNPDSRPYKDDLMNELHQRIIRDGIPFSTSVEHLDEISFAGRNLTKEMKESLYVILKQTEVMNRYQAAMAYAYGALRDTPFEKSGMEREAYLENIKEGAANFVYKTQGNFDFLYRSNIEKGLIKNLPLGKHWLTLQSPAINQMIFFGNMMRKAARLQGAEGRRAAAGAVSLIALSLFAGGVNNVPMVPDLIALVDYLDGGKNDKDYEPLLLRTEKYIKDKMIESGMSSSTVDWMTKTYRKGFFSALFDRDLSMSQAPSEMFTPFVLQKVTSFFARDIPNMKEVGLTRGLIDMVTRNWVAVGRAASGIQQLVAGEALDAKGNPLNRPFGIGDALKTIAFGENLNDRLVKEDTRLGGKNPRAPQDIRDVIGSMFGEGLKLQGVKSGKTDKAKQDIVASQKVLDAARDIEDAYNKTLRTPLVKEVRKNCMAKANELVKKNEKLVRAMASGKYEGYNQDYSSIKQQVAKDVEKFIEVQARYEVTNKFSSRLGTPKTEISAYSDKYDLGDYEPGGRLLRSYPPEEQPYVYAAINFYKKAKKAGVLNKYD